MGALRFMTAKNGKPCKKCGTSEWYKGGQCKSCAKEARRQWRQANPEKANEKNRRWRQANPEKAKEGNRRWRQANPDADAAKAHRRRTRKTKAGGSFTAAEFKAIVRHYGGKCLCCGRTGVKLTADHVVPVSKGGTSYIDNIQPLCQSCNSSKGTQTIDYRPDTGLGRWIQRKLFR